MATRPNILLILNDDMGFSDLACYGGEIRTPHLDSLAAGGLRYTQFYNTARCCPSRASLLTGLHPHQTGVGHMMMDDGLEGYLGDLNNRCVTMAEALKGAGYRSYISGKWHVTRHARGPRHNWPLQRGFDEFYGILTGAASFYQPQTLTRGNDPVELGEGEEFFLTDAISTEAVGQIQAHAADHDGSPFFQYVGYTAPHWPLHAHEEDIAGYRGRFDRGWDMLRQERLERMREMGLLHPDWELSDRDPEVGPWEEQPHKEWEARRMEVYAAQIERMDRGIGQILQALRDTGQWDNTLIFFLADNGGCAEEISPESSPHMVKQGSATATTRDGRPVRHGNLPGIMPGAEDTYASYGTAWANLSNTPFRRYKHWVHEGGIATPFIAHWPAGITARGELRHQAAQLPDVLATALDVAEQPYPETYNGHPILPAEGYSLKATFTDQPHAREVLYWEHEGNRAIRRGKWKLVCKYGEAWELHDMEAGRSETHDEAAAHPALVQELEAMHDAWMRHVGALPWDELEQHRRERAGK